jgi:AcrR family transcriptional regulator
MGVAPPSLYGAYGDKKRLFLEAVERYEQTIGCFARKAFSEEATAEGAVRRLLLDAVKAFAGPKNPKGCLVVLGATNCSAESAEVGEALAERRRGAEAVVRARLLAGQAAGEFAEHTDVDALAALVTATLFGLAIKARDGASRARLSQVVEQLMAMWPRRKAEEAGLARRP